MRTTVEMISKWYDQVKATGATHMLLVTDEWDHEDYPVPYDANDPERLGSIQQTIDTINKGDMTRVMEVYNLNLDKDSQLVPHSRVWNL